MPKAERSDVVFYPSWRFLKRAGGVFRSKGKVTVVIKGKYRAKSLQVPIRDVLEGQPQGGAGRHWAFFLNFRLGYLIEVACFKGYKITYDGDREIIIVKR